VIEENTLNRVSSKHIRASNFSNFSTTLLSIETTLLFISRIKSRMERRAVDCSGGGPPDEDPGLDGRVDDFSDKSEDDKPSRLNTARAISVNSSIRRRIKLPLFKNWSVDNRGLIPSSVRAIRRMVSQNLKSVMAGDNRYRLVHVSLRSRRAGDRKIS